MGAVVIKVLNMSITAGFLVLAVLLVRLLFKKKAPKALFPILWAMVAVRLVCPVTFESRFSLIQNAEPVEQMALPVEFWQKETVHNPSEGEALPEGVEPVEIPKELLAGEHFMEIGASEFGEDISGTLEGTDEAEYPGAEGVASADNLEGQDASGKAESIIKETPFSVTYTETAEDGTEFTMKRTDLFAILAVVWLCGIGGMLLYTVISYIRIYQKVRESAPLAENVRLCDRIDSPFILGIVRPKIYLPSDIDAADREFVLAHERAHLKRLDHIWKPLGFLLLSVYWFHPLLWVAYVLLCKDIEYACDEKVIKELGAEQKKNYSTALINCSVSRKMISACPLAFGETGVKGRVKSVLHYKKPAFWIIIASVVISGVLAVCFLTNPLRKKELPKAGDIITFGTYEQDNVTENGAEPIEWIVVDVFDGKATLLSKYGLDAKSFHEDGTKGIYWEDCSLRNWLNSEFFEIAFDEKEQEQILTTRLDNHSNATYNVKDGAVTEDKVYLLSIDELYQIYKPEAGLNESKYRNEAGIVTATDYAKAQGAWEGKTEDGSPACPWLLRTLGVNYASVCRVNTDGELSHEVSNDYGGCAIRPAMRINLEDAEYVITELAEAPAEDEEKTVYTGSGRFKDLVSLEKAKPGYVVEFGSYEQNQDTSDGTEPLEWYVLDVKDGKALLLSKYILENMPYHKYEEEVSWENCTLREWLNGAFYDAAFSDEEKKRIATTLLENVWNPWNPNASYEYTEDKVFLPSMEDMLSGDYFYTEKAPESAAYTFDGYFSSDTERMAKGVYEEEQWIYYSDGSRLYDFDGIPYEAYWLRASSRTEYEPGDSKKEEPHLVVAGISIDGSLDTSAYNTIGNTSYDKKGVRPAIWVELGDLDKIEKKNEEKNSKSDKKSSLFLSSKLPERYEYKEVKETFLEYLNHQAYLYPAEYSREKWECTFEVYSTADSKMKRIYLKADVNGEERWYLCTPTIYLEEDSPLTILPMDAESVESLRSAGAVTYLGNDTVKVTAAKAPEYHKNTELDTTGYQESIALISDELCKNGYLLKNETHTDVIKLEAWISEFDMEKKLYPHAYIIINDTYVYETRFTKYKGLYTTFYDDNYTKDYSLENHFGEQLYMPDEFDGRSIKPLASVDQEQLEHVKNCAVLHYVHEPDFSVTITVDGKEVTLPKQNICIKWEGFNSIAFVPQETTGDITWYHIYRSTDGGERWSLVSKEFQTNAEEIAAIEVPEGGEYVICYFNRIGSTYHSSCYFSEDGGVTWSMPKQSSKPKVALSDAAAGTSVVFGSYEQDFDLSNGKEPLEWIVLDRVGDKALLLSRFGLDADWYYHINTWEESEVRRELNEYFYVDAFSPSERERIVKTEIKTPNDSGVNIVTEDYVFLLSESEVSEGKAQDGTPYFKDAEARLTIPVPMRGIGAWVYSDCENDEWDGIQTKWLLRANGSNMNKVWVTKEGTVKTDGTSYERETVEVLYRPAIWVDVSVLTGK